MLKKEKEKEEGEEKEGEEEKQKKEDNKNKKENPSLSILSHVCYRDREEKTGNVGIKHNAGAKAGSWKSHVQVGYTFDSHWGIFKRFICTFGGYSLVDSYCLFFDEPGDRLLWLAGPQGKSKSKWLRERRALRRGDR